MVLMLIVKCVLMYFLNIFVYIEVVKKMNCLLLVLDVERCCFLEYYCVLSDDLKYVVEVCVLFIYIVGR